jgi:hypothetical protein
MSKCCWQGESRVTYSEVKMLIFKHKGGYE